MRTLLGSQVSNVKPRATCYVEVLTTETLGITFTLGILSQYFALAELAPYMRQQQTGAGDVSLTGAFTITPDALLNP